MHNLDERDMRWHPLSDEVISGMNEWRPQHPRATFREIEQALDERLARLRARMLPDAALASRATVVSTLDDHERRVCPQCGSRMEPHGQPQRELTSSDAQTLKLKRSYAVCPHGKRGFSPLDGLKTTLKNCNC